MSIFVVFKLWQQVASRMFSSKASRNTQHSFWSESDYCCGHSQNRHAGNSNVTTLLCFATCVLARSAPEDTFGGGWQPAWAGGCLGVSPLCSLLPHVAHDKPRDEQQRRGDEVTRRFSRLLFSSRLSLKCPRRQRESRPSHDSSFLSEMTRVNHLD